MNKQGRSGSLFAALALFLAACAPNPEPTATPRVQATATRAPISSVVALATPQATRPRPEFAFSDTLLVVGEPVDVVVTAPGNPERIELSADDQSLGEAQGGALRAQWTPGQVGEHLLLARTTYPDGSSGEGSVTVQVSAPAVQKADTPVPATMAPTPTATIASTRMMQSTATVRATVPPAPTAQLEEPVAANTEPVRITETTISIPTYPYARFQQEATYAPLNLPFKQLNRSAYDASNPRPVATSYKLIVMENEYLRLSILPDLGGRLYEVVYKPTGHNEMYRNPVLKPSPWGPALDAPGYQMGWLAAGGMEWGFPIEEHGLESNLSWGYITLPREDLGTVTVFDGGKNRPNVTVDISLGAGRADFSLTTTIRNPSAASIRYKYWLNAMLSPGGRNKPSNQLRFLFPVTQMTVHSSGDRSLPAAGQAFSWPIYNGRDMSLLGTYTQYVGFFERPAAAGDWMGIYDGATDEGMIRIYPSQRARGAKAFTFGYSQPLAPSLYTDDDSAYVELHGGVAPTFDDWANLEAGGSYNWTETWYPVAGIRGVVTAGSAGAMNLDRTGDQIQVSLLSPQPVQGTLVLSLAGHEIARQAVDLQPGVPFTFTSPGSTSGTIHAELLDSTGRSVLIGERAG